MLRIFVVSLLLKILIGTLLPLSPDEAYYWMWSHHPQLSYFDHPPFIAWIMALGQPVEGWMSAVRIPGILLGHLTFGLWLMILKPRVSSQALGIFALLYVLSPLTGPGSIILTPDLPLMFFWSLSFYIFLRWLETPTFRYASILGLALGLGFISKYNMVVFFILALITVIAKKLPPRIWAKQIPVMLLAFLFASLPLWLWNLNNGFLSFTFQLNHGLGEKIFKPEWPLMYILGQLLILTPFGAWAIVKKPFRREDLVYWIFALGPLAFFMLTSFKGRVEANWPAVAYPMLLMLFATSTSTKVYRYAVVVWSISLVVVLSDIMFLWLPVPSEKLKTRELYAFDDLTAVTEQYQPLYARSYQMASKVSFDSKRFIYKLRGVNRVDFYDFRDESMPTSEPFYLIVEKGESTPVAWRKLWKTRVRHPVSQKFEVLEIYKR